MELWIDTSDIGAIQEAEQLGILHGVTTNPSIFSRAGQAAEPLIRELLTVQKGLLAVQVTHTQSADTMIAQAKQLAAISPRIVVKIPAQPAGFTAITVLKKQGVMTLATAITSMSQFAFAALSGADYAALYLRHMQESGKNILAEIEKMLYLSHKRGWSVKLMGAAFLDVDMVHTVLASGLPAITLPENILSALLTLDPLVTQQLEQFEMDWHSYQQQHDSGLLNNQS